MSFFCLVWIYHYPMSYCHRPYWRVGLHLLQPPLRIGSAALGLLISRLNSPSSLSLSSREMFRALSIFMVQLCSPLTDPHLSHSKGCRAAIQVGSKQCAEEGRISRAFGTISGVTSPSDTAHSAERSSPVILQGAWSPDVFWCSKWLQWERWDTSPSLMWAWTLCSSSKGTCMWIIMRALFSPASHDTKFSLPVFHCFVYPNKTMKLWECAPSVSHCGTHWCQQKTVWI